MGHRAVKAATKRDAQRRPTRLHAAGDDDVVSPGDDTGRREMDGVLGRTVLPFNGCRGHPPRPAGCQHGISRHVECLLSDLADAAPDDAVDIGGIDAAPFDEAA